MKSGDFPGGSIVKNPPAKYKGHRFEPWSGKIPHAVGQVRLPQLMRQCCKSLWAWEALLTSREEPPLTTTKEAHSKWQRPNAAGNRVLTTREIWQAGENYVQSITFWKNF